MNDRLRQAAVLIAAILQALSPGWSYVTGIGQPIWERSDAVVTPATPATYAFGIWSFIFVSSLAYAMFTLWSDPADPLFRRIGWWSALAFLLNAVWGMMQQVQGVTWATCATILAIAACAVLAFRPVARSADLTTSRSWLVAVPLGVLAGWITAASPVNIDQAIAFEHAETPLSPTGRAIATLFASAGLVALLLRPLRAHPAFVGAAIWALVGIAAANLTRETNLPVAAVAAALAAALAGAASAVRLGAMRRRPA